MNFITPESEVQAQPSLAEYSDSHSADLVAGLPAPENKQFYPALDGLRALAVLLVFYSHYSLSPRPGLAWGWTGVNIFFVLSGFLITGILYDTRNSAYRFRNFYVRRTLRIFPLYYGILLITLLLYPIFRWEWHPTWFMWPLYISNYSRFIWMPAYINGSGIVECLRSTRQFHPPFLLLFGHFWSLAAEEQFYLVWPLVVFLVKDRIWLRNICLSACILTPLVRLACFHLIPHVYIDNELLYRITPFRADGFLLGGLITLMLRGPESRWLFKLLRPAFYFLIAGIVVSEIIYRSHMHHFIYSANTPTLSSIGYSIINLFCAFLILLSLEPGSFFYRLFTLRPLHRLGQMSYGFYVFHNVPICAYILLVAHFYKKSGPAFTYLVALVGFIFSLALSYLSYRFYETRFLRLKDRFTV
ncbi:MAG: acyltransferase [Acidobacteriaceae bacterium]|nr:acyltransferase [Acidobacteriaceae bacterium]